MHWDDLKYVRIYIAVFCACFVFYKFMKIRRENRTELQNYLYENRWSHVWIFLLPVLLGSSMVAWSFHDWYVDYLIGKNFPLKTLPWQIWMYSFGGPIVLFLWFIQDKAKTLRLEQEDRHQEENLLRENHQKLLEWASDYSHGRENLAMAAVSSLKSYLNGDIFNKPDGSIKETRNPYFQSTLEFFRTMLNNRSTPVSERAREVFIEALIDNRLGPECSSISLREMNFSDQSFDKSTIDQYKFDHSNCTSCSFRNVSARKSRFWKTTLNNADFSGSDLREACLSNALVENTRFIGADLSNAEALNVDFRTTDLSRAKLHNLKINTKTRFSKKDYIVWLLVNPQERARRRVGALKNRLGSEFPESTRLHMEKSFRVSNYYQNQNWPVVSNQNLSHSYLGHTNLDRWCFDKSTFIHAGFLEAGLRGAVFRGAFLENCDFGFSDLRDADFTRATLINVDFRGADMAHAKFREATLIGCNFGFPKVDQEPSSVFSPSIRQDLTHADFMNAKIRDCIFRGVSFESSRFDGAFITKGAFEKCSLNNAIFDAANIYDASWKASNVRKIGSLKKLEYFALNNPSPFEPIWFFLRDGQSNSKQVLDQDELGSTKKKILFRKQVVRHRYVIYFFFLRRKLKTLPYKIIYSTNGDSFDSKHERDDHSARTGAG